MRPRLLSLFCGAGGDSMGYHRAGFDVTGVDIHPQPRYPFKFIQADALEYLSDYGHEYDVRHGSPPCQDHSALAKITGQRGNGWLLDATRQAFRKIGGPYVIENVPGAAMVDPITLCGTEFGLSTVSPVRGQVWLRRHRLFESNQFLMGAGGCHCTGKQIIGVYGNGDGGGRGWKGSIRDRRAVMGIDWMNRNELAQSIPPAYTEFVGGQVLDQLREAA